MQKTLFILSALFFSVGLALFAYVQFTWERMTCDEQKDSQPRIVWTTGIIAFFCFFISFMCFIIGAREMCSPQQLTQQPLFSQLG